jgi:hypothetical protein
MGIIANTTDPNPKNRDKKRLLGWGKTAIALIKEF